MSSRHVISCFLAWQVRQTPVLPGMVTQQFPMQTLHFLPMECQEILWNLSLCNKPSYLPFLFFFFPTMPHNYRYTKIFSIYMCLLKFQKFGQQNRIGKLTLIRLLTYATHCCTCLMYINLFTPYNITMRQVPLLIPIFQIRRIRCRDIKWLP